ncbi:MAG: hypothetical protein ACP5IC_00580 [Minisyncoccia bacterium]
MSLLINNIVNAQTDKPFGGKVIPLQIDLFGIEINLLQAGITCTGEGPYFIIPADPVNIPIGPYLIVPGMTKEYGSGKPSVSSHILGLYFPVMITGLCWTNSAPPAPIPVFVITMYGT